MKFAMRHQALSRSRRCCELLPAHAVDPTAQSDDSLRRRKASRRSPITASARRRFHRARQGAHPSALRELPSRRRPSAPGRAWPAAPAAGRARRRRPWARRPCAARSATSRPISIPAGMPGHPEWHLAPRRDGVGGQVARTRSASRSRTPRAMAAGRWRSRPSHRRGHAGRLGLGARFRPGAGARHPEAGGCPGRGLGEFGRRLPGLASKLAVG